MKGAQKNRAVQLNSDLQRVGFKTKWNQRNLIRPHGASVTAPHWHVKCAFCRYIDQENHFFFTEVDHPERGTPDILWLHLDDLKAYVIEVETDATREKKVEKAKQYTNDGNCDVVADCFTHDPLDAPLKIPELEHWVQEEIR